MEIDLTKFKDVGVSRGGKMKPTFSLGKQGYVNINGAYLEANEDYKNANSVNMKVMKDNEKVIILINFLKDREGTFKINNFKDKNGIIKRKSFSLRSAFKEIDKSYRDFAQNKVIRLNPVKKELGELSYYVIELLL